MDVRELFDQNPWWKDKGLIEDDYDLVSWREKPHRWVPELVGRIGLEPFALHALTGPRQSGKTTLLKLLVKKLLDDGREPRSVFYFNCENLADYRELLEVLTAYLDFKGVNSVKSGIILLDEVTLPKEWYRAVKFLVDKGNLRNDVLIVTGSSSMEVKREVELFPGRRGRGRDFVVYPLSFRGFLKVVEPQLVQKIQPLSSIGEFDGKIMNALMFENELNNHLGVYMEYGGFPLSVANLHKSAEDAKKAYLSWIKNAVLKAERSDVIARQVGKVLVETLQTDLSWEGVSKKIEVKSPKTVSAYVGLLSSIFAVNILYNIDVSGKKIRFGRNKKVHFRDPLLLKIFEDWCMVKSLNRESAVAEALLVEHLVRMFPGNVFFWKNGFEIDAIAICKNQLYGFEMKWSEAENAHAKSLNQLKKFITVTKRGYSSKPLKVPLAVFLSLFEV